MAPRQRFSAAASSSMDDSTPSNTPPLTSTDSQDSASSASSSEVSALTSTRKNLRKQLSSDSNASFAESDVARENQARVVLGPLQVAAEPVDTFGCTGEHQPASVSTIQVSLLPPPWEELTTSEPFRRATRVSPPAVTYCFSPCRMKGRRSRCRGSILSLQRVGAVDRASAGCAM